VSSKTCLLFFALYLAACNSSEQGVESGTDAVGSTRDSDDSVGDADTKGLVESDTAIVSDAAVTSDAAAVGEDSQSRLDAAIEASSPALDTAVVTDTALVDEDEQSRLDAAVEACSPALDAGLTEGGTHTMTGPANFGPEVPYLPEGSGDDGQLCWTMCSTRRCIPFGYEFASEGDGEECVDKCVQSYQHARANAPEACLEAMARRDEVYLSAPCDCHAEQVAREISSDLDRACVLTSESAEGTELAEKCMESCVDQASDSGAGEPHCFEQCVADLSRYWLLGGSLCLELELDFRTCVAHDPSLCEPGGIDDVGEAAFYNCMQAMR
jgi:hypothetical protein